MVDDAGFGVIEYGLVPVPHALLLYATKNDLLNCVPQVSLKETETLPVGGLEVEGDFKVTEVELLEIKDQPDGHVQP